MISANFKDKLIATGWYPHLEEYFNSPNWIKLRAFLEEEYNSHQVYPKLTEIFRVLTLPLVDVKVVIVGQDPYHGPGQANGLAFAVNKGQALPPSLRNIFNELSSDLNKNKFLPGTDLLSWHEQGVMLLNTALTVRHGEAGSHSKVGWSELTDIIIKTISDQQRMCVFILWGAAAKAKKPLIDISKHGIIESGHPSPLSCKLFYGTKPFSKTNEILNRYGIKPINWSKQ